MYLIHLPAEKAGIDHWLFFDQDPRTQGCTQNVVEGVDYRDQTQAADHRRSQSGHLPRLGRSELNPSIYRLFPSRLSATFEFEFLEGFAFQFRDWQAFMRTPIAKDDDCNSVL